jgi:hypothetical protein
METHYLNTDLEIESKNDLSRIVEEFGDDVVVLYHGETRGYQHASFEIDSGGTNAGADEVINAFCYLVENLPDEVRAIWEGCCSKVFDVGYESGSSPRNFRSELRAPTIQRVAAIGAGVVITIYSLSNESEDEPAQSRYEI